MCVYTCECVCMCVCTVLVIEARGGREVEALRYKPEAAGSIPDGVLPAAL